MSSLNQVSGFSAAGGRSGALKRIADEISALARALLNPGKIIREVEQMHALHTLANRIEATDRARADALRRTASRIGLD